MKFHSESNTVSILGEVFLFGPDPRNSLLQTHISGYVTAFISAFIDYAKVLWIDF